MKNSAIISKGLRLNYFFFVRSSNRKRQSSLKIKCGGKFFLENSFNLRILKTKMTLVVRAACKIVDNGSIQQFEKVFLNITMKWLDYYSL